MRKILSEKIGLPLSDKLNKHQTRKFYQLFISSLNWSKDELISYQVKKVKELLEYSYKYSPFYKKRLDDSGLNIKSFNYLDELQKIPPLTRSDIQNNLNSIVSSEFALSEYSRGSSSGSTGHPVIYYHDKIGTSASKASALFSRYLSGYRMGDPWINIWGNPTAVNVEWKKPGSK
ncbi:MAG: hypothetical protein ABI550_03890, partial [Ignavibacteriaceae bacterium]